MVRNQLRRAGIDAEIAPTRSQLGGRVVRILADRALPEDLELRIDDMARLFDIRVDLGHRNRVTSLSELLDTASESPESARPEEEVPPADA